jgi:hypothetical protein
LFKVTLVEIVRRGWTALHRLRRWSWQEGRSVESEERCGAIRAAAGAYWPLLLAGALPITRTASFTCSCSNFVLPQCRSSAAYESSDNMLSPRLFSHFGRRLSGHCAPLGRRTIVQFNRPGPPPLAPEDQHEFEELVRKAQGGAPSSQDALGALHPDARQPLAPEFEGDVNPVTGERGGPKREPVRRWNEEGDWSYKGRVSDF